MIKRSVKIPTLEVRYGSSSTFRARSSHFRNTPRQRTLSSGLKAADHLSVYPAAVLPPLPAATTDSGASIS